VLQNQMKGAETQISQTLLEMEGEKEIARLRLKPKGGLIQTASFIRYTAPVVGPSRKPASSRCSFNRLSNVPCQ